MSVESGTEHFIYVDAEVKERARAPWRCRVTLPDINLTERGRRRKGRFSSPQLFASQSAIQPVKADETTTGCLRG